MDYKGYVIHHNTNRDVCAVISGDKVLAVVGTIAAAKRLVDSYSTSYDDDDDFSAGRDDTAWADFQHSEFDY